MIDGAMQELVDDAARSGHVGIVAGLAVGDETSIATAGHVHRDDPQPPHGKTLFRIASLSKVFTGAALASRIAAGDLALDDTAASRLPATFRIRTYDKEPIRIEHLVTHTSGLPRGPDNFDPNGSLEDYLRALSCTKPRTAPGVVHAYSNLGAQIVGMILTGGGAQTYDDMLRETIADRIGLPDIVEWPDEEQQGRTAHGHDEGGEPCHTPTYAPGVASGGLYGTVEDLLRFLRAHWSGDHPDLQRATKPRVDAFEGNQCGMFWLTGLIPDGDGVRATWHNGGVPGFRSFLALLPEERIGVAVLTNTSKPVEALGARILRARLARS